MAWFFRAPLLSGGVDAAHAQLPGPNALFEMGEMAYEVQPALAQQARLVRGGVFPSWTPYSQAGSPLLGKMQGGVFAPYHLPLYLLPAKALGAAFTLIEALKFYLAFAAAYLLARALGLALWPGVLAAQLYVCSQAIAPGLLLSWNGAGIALPLLLLLAEKRFSGERTLFLLFWPWAVALPFFSGHFEGAARMFLVGAAYYGARLLAQPGLDAARRAADYGTLAALSAAGAALAGVQIAPAWEYVSQSYNRVWHSSDAFGWQFETLSKRLTGADLPLLAAGLTLLAGCAIFLRPGREDEAPLARPRLLRLAAASALLAGAAACLGRLGLDESLSCLRFSVGRELSGWAAGIGLLVPALWEWRRAAPGSAMRVLGWLLLASAAVGLKLPGLADLLVRLPVIKDFHNATYRWEFHLSLGLLAAAGIQRAQALAPERRTAEALRLLTAAAALSVGLWAAPPLGEKLARRADTSPVPPKDGGPGGFLGPERLFKQGGAFTASLWVPFDAKLTGVTIGTVGQESGLKKLDTGYDTDGKRVRVWARMVLPDSGLTQNFHLGATVLRDGQPPRHLIGPVIVQEPVGEGPAGRKLLPLVPAAAALLPLAGPWAAAAAGAALALWSADLYRSQAMPAAEVPYRLPGVAAMKPGDGLFRLASPVDAFFRADYQAMYGLAGLRPGGDNIDVLTVVHFGNLVSAFLADGKNETRLDQGFRLMGAANVRYLVMPPGAKLAHPALEPAHMGADMEVYRLRREMPRALFYDRWTHVPFSPISDWSDPAARARFRDPYKALFDAKGFDPAATLALHDEPVSVPRAPGSAVPARAKTAVESYAPDRVSVTVETDRPGLLFLSDNHFPGWRAAVNGRPAPILRAWVAFRAVEVPAGLSRVEFRYRPALSLLAAAVSALLALAWLPLWGLAWKRRPWAGPAGPDWTLASALVVPALLFWSVWAVLPRSGTW